jgi:hypothetical protein
LSVAHPVLALAVKLFMVGLSNLPDYTQDLFYLIPIFAFGMIVG